MPGGGFCGSRGGGKRGGPPRAEPQAGDIVVIGLWEGKPWKTQMKWWKAKLLRLHKGGGKRKEAETHICWVVEWVDAKDPKDKEGFFYPITGPDKQGPDEWVTLAEWDAMVASRSRPGTTITTTTTTTTTTTINRRPGRETDKFPEAEVVD